MSKKILITGSAGFIGSNLYKHLSNKGYEVTGVDRMKSDTVNYFVDLAHPSKLDKAFLENAIKSADIIFHFAASVGVEVLENPKEILNSYNIDHKFLKMVNKHLSDKTKVIYASSSEVYGNNIDAKEDDIIKLIPKNNNYSIQKLMTEELLKAYDIPHIIVRFFNISGNNQSKNFVIPRFVEKAKNNEDIIVYYNDECPNGSFRTFMDIRDTVEVLEKLIFLDDNEEIINVGNDENILDMHSLAEKIKAYFNSESQIILKKQRENEIKLRKPNIRKMIELTRYKPKYNIIDIIRNIDEADS